MSKIKEDIMSKIKSDKITMKARWVYLAKRIGLQSGLALSVVVAVLAVNAFFYYIKSNGLLLPLHYGPARWQEFLHSLPYDLIIIIILLFLLINYVIKKFDFSYKQPFIIILAAFLAFIVLAASVLFASNFNRLLKGGLEKCRVNIPYVSDFYAHRCCGKSLCPARFNH